MMKQWTLVVWIALIYSLFCGVTPGICQERRVELEVDGWVLIGDFGMPAADGPVPAVVMLHKANGNRKEYEQMAKLLNERGIATLRIDLRAHGESINKGVFVPYTDEGLEIIKDTKGDVAAIDAWIRKQPGVDSNAIGYVGASYSAEFIAAVGRERGYSKAYVCLSGGSFSDESIAAMDASGAAWWHIVTKNERYLKEIIAEVKRVSRTAKVTELEGTEHATRILPAHPEIEPKIADWFAEKLK